MPDDVPGRPFQERWPLPRFPGHLLRRCQQRAVDLFVAEVGESGPTPPQFALLLAIFHHPGASQAELVRLSGIDRSTLAEMVRRLVARGWVRRRRTAHDQRANALAITDAGRATLEAAYPAMERAQARILDPLPKERHAAFLADLALVAGLAEDPRPAAAAEAGRRRISRR